jgi:hypothetical protein
MDYGWIIVGDLVIWLVIILSGRSDIITYHHQIVHIELVNDCKPNTYYARYARYCQMTSDIVSSVNYPNTTREAIRSIRMIRDLTQSTTSHHWRFAYWN